MNGIEKEIKSLQSMLLRPVKFLEEKFNTSDALARSKFDSQKEEIESLKSQLSLCNDRIDTIGSIASSAVERSKWMQNALESYVDKMFLEEKLSGEIKPIRVAMEIIREQQNKDSAEIARLSENDEKTRFILGDISIEVADLKKASLIDRDFMKKIESVVLKAVDEQEKKHQFIDSNFKIQLEYTVNTLCETKEALEKIFKMNEEITAKVKSDSVRLFKSMDQKFADMIEDLSEDISCSKKQRTDVITKLEEFENRILKVTRAIISGKDLEDFTRQISFNAQQIAKFQKALEEEK